MIEIESDLSIKKVLFTEDEGELPPSYEIAIYRDGYLKEEHTGVQRRIKGNPRWKPRGKERRDLLTREKEIACERTFLKEWINASKEVNFNVPEWETNLPSYEVMMFSLKGVRKILTTFRDSRYPFSEEDCGKIHAAKSLNATSRCSLKKLLVSLYRIILQLKKDGCDFDGNDEQVIQQLKEIVQLAKPS